MEKVSFQNPEKLNLAGVLHLPKANTERAVIIAHGFTSNKDRPRHIKLAEALAGAGVAALRFDFGGCGESDDREITIKAQIDDLRSAVSHLKDKGYSQIGYLGESLGGITALKAYDSDIAAMVLWAPVTKAWESLKVSAEEQKSLETNGYFIREKDNREFKIPREYVDERVNLDREEVLERVRVPVMIIHGTTDKVIPISDSEEAVKLLPAGSRLEKIENWQHGDHKMDESMDEIIPLTVRWFNEHV